MPGTDFDERAHAISVHRANLLHEVDRPDDLLREQVAGFRFSLGILGASGIGIYRHFPFAKCDASQGLRKRRPRVSHECTVEGCRYLQDTIPNRTSGQLFRSTLDLPERPRQDGLLRGVAICHHQLTFLVAQETLHHHLICLDRQHRATIAVASSACHQSAANVGNPMQRFGRDAAGTTQCEQLTVTMAARRVDGDTKITKYIKRTNAHRAKGRLRDFRSLESLFLAHAHVVGKSRMRINGIAQARFAGHGRIARKSCIGFTQSVEHAGKLTGNVAQHADVLRALAREQCADLALSLA